MKKIGVVPSLGAGSYVKSVTTRDNQLVKINLAAVAGLIDYAEVCALAKVEHPYALNERPEQFGDNLGREPDNAVLQKRRSFICSIIDNKIDQYKYEFLSGEVSGYGEVQLKFLNDLKEFDS